MTSTIITKNSSTASSVPLAADLTQGELAVNVTDKKLYSKDSGGSVVKLVGSLGNQEANAAAITGGTINGTAIGGTTAAAVSATTLSASSTVSGTGFSNYLASPPAIGGTTAAAGSFTTVNNSGGVRFNTSGTEYARMQLNSTSLELMAGSTTTAGITLNSSNVATLTNNPVLTAGTANGVTYLNGSKVLTSGSALTFDGTNLGLSGLGSRFINLGSTSTNGQSVALQISAPNSDASASVYRIGSGLTADNELVSYDVTNTQIVDKYIRGSSGYRAFYQNGSEGMRLTSTGLGIGTSSPSAKLHVNGSTGSYLYTTSTALSNLGAYFGMNSSGYAEIEVLGSYPLRFNTGGGEKMRLDSAGNLGLGVTPNANWTDFKVFQTTEAAILSYTGQTHYTQNAYYQSGTWKYISASSLAATRYQHSSGIHYWYNAPSGAAGTTITWTQAMTLDGSGNLGLAETSPSAYGGFVTKYAGIGLHANSTSGASGLNLYESGTGRFSLRTLNGSAGLSFYDSFNGAERARIDSSGNLLVGTTSGYSSRVGILWDSSTQSSIIMRTSSATLNGNPMVFQDSGGTARGSISQTASAVAYNTSSDYRLKNTIAPMTGALAKVALLKPCTYKWNVDGSDGEGFIAHELAEVCPHAVTGEKDAVDEDGNPKYQGIDTSFLVATLTAAIQELKAEFDAYKASHP